MSKDKIHIYSRLYNTKLNYPNIYSYGYKGEALDICDLIHQIIGISCISVNYVGDNLIIRMNSALDVGQKSQLDLLVVQFVEKDSITPIEQLQINWNKDDRAVFNMLGTIESDLRTIYLSAPWSSFSIIEKMILSSWHIPSQIEKLEVFTQEQLDSFRYYKIYRGTSESIRYGLNKADIYKIPNSIDFKKDLGVSYHKKRDDMIKGRPTKKEYYFNYDNINFEYGDIFAEIEFTFIDDPSSKLILQKQAFISWYWNDNTTDTNNKKDIGESFHPVLDGKLRIVEGETRRGNIYTNIKFNVVGMVGMTEVGGDFVKAETLIKPVLELLKDDFDTWIQTGSTHQSDLIAAILAIPTDSVFITGSADPTTSNVLIGVGTLFSTELSVGDRIKVSGEIRTVVSIIDNLSLTVDIPFSDTGNDTNIEKLESGWLLNVIAAPSTTIRDFVISELLI